MGNDTGRHIWGVGKQCPYCGSNQFSISVPKLGMPRPAHWGPGVLGEADCACGNNFLVKLAPELEKAVTFLLEAHYREVDKFISPRHDALDVAKILFLK